MSLHLSTVHTHALTRQTTVLSGHWCNQCNQAINAESYRCSACNFDMCGSCLGKTKATMPTRVHVHPLVYTTTNLFHHFCDLCASATTRDAWRCDQCNFDVCTSCFETVSLPKPVVASTEVKVVTPMIAKHVHPLVATTGAPSHFCDGCRASVASVAVHRCADCNFEYCQSCHIASQAEVTRFHAHPLTYTTSNLSGHFCDVCRVPTTTASYRCAADNFDLCVPCYNRAKAPKPVPVPRPVVPVEAKVHAHPLVRTTTGLANKFCDGCRATPLSVSYRCVADNFDLCTSCYDSINKRVVSLHPHALTYTNTGVDTHWCDGCRASIGTAGAYRCSSCNFDLCTACINRCVVPKPVPAVVPVVDHKEPIMTKAHGHALLRTTTGLQHKFCDGCRATSLSVSYQCAACNFDLCATCMNRNRSSQVTRMHAHPLIFTRGLVNNTCDDCRKGISASWRCSTCDFDLCGVCFVRAKMVKPRPIAPVPVVAPSSPAVPVVEVKAVDVGVAVKTHTHVVLRNTGSLIGKYCDNCSSSPLTEAFSCVACNYDMCTTCYNANRVEQTTRLHAHAMTWTTNLSSHYCDLCKRGTESAYRCSLCNYDACSSCFDAARVPVPTAPAAPVVVVASPAVAAVAVPVVATPVAAAAVASSAFWPCSACTYINVAAATECYICATTKP